MSYENIDLVVVGAGVVGCVVAERVASQLGWRCAVLEKRDHIAGNCYDFLDENGLLVPQYAPHYFATNVIEPINYLSKFTAWLPLDSTQQVNVSGQAYSFPIDLEAITKFFNHPEFTIDEAKRLVDSLKKNTGNPENAEQYVLSILGQELYDTFYLNYIQKQWGAHPRELSPSIFTEPLIPANEKDLKPFKLMPVDGYSKMFSRVVSNPLIEIELETDYLKIKELVKPAKATLYTGAIDSYFNYKQGYLPWQKVKYALNNYKENQHLSAIKEIDLSPETELVFKAENKQLTRQKSDFTGVTHCEIHPKGEHYYPIHTQENLDIYERYRQIAEHETFINKVYFGGGLAQFKQQDIADSVSSGLSIFNRLKNDFS